MKTTRPCRACKEANMEEVAYSEDLTVKGVDLHVEGLLHWACPNCNAAIETAAQMDHNGELVQRAYQQYKATFKKENGLLTGEEIRRFRTEIWEITQKQAATIFGGGPTAFSKYESEDVTQSSAMNKLLSLAAELPSAYEWLINNSGDAEIISQHKSKRKEQEISQWSDLILHFVAQEKSNVYTPQPSISKHLTICANDHSYQSDSEAMLYLEA